MPAKRTVVLDSSLDDPNSWVPWLGNKTTNPSAAKLTPLSELLSFTHRRRLRSTEDMGNRGSVYVQIGQEDVLAFPELLPGSIVRVNPRLSDLILRDNGTASKEIFLIEHSKGFWCCQLRLISDNIIVPVSAQLSYSQLEMRMPTEVRVLGVVDLEIRPGLVEENPEVPNDLGTHWKPVALNLEPKFGRLLRESRAKMNLSLREASVLSRRMAELLSDKRYFISQSSLSDYEVLDTPPRHLHKSITLCVLFGLQFQKFLSSIGVNGKEEGAESMPDDLLPRSIPPRFRNNGEDRTPNDDGFLVQLLGECGDIPFFLRNSMEAISGLPAVSLHDVFWSGGERNPIHPYLKNSLLIVVNRRKRKPIFFRSRPIWQQPLYVLLKRDGTYLCASCEVENGILVVHPHSRYFYRETEFRYHRDAEVIGQVVTIARACR